MGQAKQRGTKQERAAQAVAEGRPKLIKEDPAKPEQRLTNEIFNDPFTSLTLFGMYNAMKRKKAGT